VVLYVASAVPLTYQAKTYDLGMRGRWDHDVLLEPRWLQEALEALISHEVCFVGARCPVDVAQSRERARGNRIVRTARGQYEWVHAHGIDELLRSGHTV
jgi:chloramphenicol 3-O-phosphotransferase